MTNKDSDIILDENIETTEDAAVSKKQMRAEKAEQQLQETLKKIQETAQDSDTHITGLQQLSMKSVLGGDFLTADFVRAQVGLILLVVAFTLVYIAFRYQYQQDMVTIRKLEIQLKDAKNKALAASSTLTEKCRESHVLETLQQNKDSVLHIADQPPYIIQVPEN